MATSPDACSASLVSISISAPFLTFRSTMKPITLSRGRCYGRTAAEVIEKAGAFNSSLRATGILSCGKHFPGYASAALDPHHELPVIERSREAMEEHELAVFRSFAEQVDSMMIAHISVSGLEAGELPASLSPALIKGLLRGDLGFGGLIMTDDLDMGAILNHYGFEETMKRGIRAGNDLLMICHRVELAAQAEKSARIACPPANSNPPWPRVAKFKSRLAPPESFSRSAFLALDAEIWDLRVSTLGAEQAARAQPRGRQTLARRAILSCRAGEFQSGSHRTVPDYERCSAATSAARVLTVTAVPTRRIPSKSGLMSEVIALNRPMQSEMAHVIESYDSRFRNPARFLQQVFQ